MRELWRMVRPGGQLAITTWGPRIFEPIYPVWRETVKAVRPDLYSAFNPGTVSPNPSLSASSFVTRGGEAQVVPQAGLQPLRSPEDWWTIALGSGLRWTIDRMGPAATQVRAANLAWLREHRVEAIETNVIYARPGSIGRDSVTRRCNSHSSGWSVNVGSPRPDQRAGTAASHLQ